MKRSYLSVVRLPGVPFAMTSLVRSGDQLACRHWPPDGTIGPDSVPPPWLPIVVRRYICAWLSPVVRPLVNAMRPFVPERTAPAVDGRAASRATPRTATIVLRIGVGRPSHMRGPSVKWQPAHVSAPRPTFRGREGAGGHVRRCEPGSCGCGDDPRRHRERVPRVQREQGPSVRADLRPERAAAELVEPHHWRRG